jgi:uncharacterized membrane protein
MVRALLLILFLSALALFFPVSSQAQVLPPEYISHFESTISIQQNTNLLIEERISFHTDIPRHGIYRYIPYRSTRSGVNHTTEISDIEVENEKGTKYQVEKTRENGILNLRIGDPDETFTGEKTYVIRYQVEKALQQYDSADELYLDITGEGWQFPVLSVSTSILSPHAEIGQLRCFTGFYGSKDTDCSFQITAEGALFQTTTSIEPGENFTVVSELKRPNQLNFPTAEKRFIASIIDNWWIPTLFLPSAIMTILWLKKGRDWMFLSPNVFADDEASVQQKKPLFHRFRVPMVYEPIQHLTPAEVGAIENEQLEPREIVAEIVDLARQKLLKIEAHEKTGILGTSLGESTEYSLHRLSKAEPKNLPEHQSYLLQELFRSGKQVEISKLRGKFSTKWQKFQELIWESVTKKGYFSANPKKVQGIYSAVAIVLLALAFILAAVVVEQRVDSFVPFLLVILQIPICILFALALPRKTARGVNIFLQAKGLKETIKRGAWREKVKEKHLFIEEVFPFAVAFGVVDQLSKQMQQLGEEPPQYLSNAALTAASFQNFSQDFTSEVSSDLSYNPSSSHSSGGSGFSSGGGFSGGGGGGGGGGSW